MRVLASSQQPAQGSHAAQQVRALTRFTRGYKPRRGAANAHGHAVAVTQGLKAAEELHLGARPRWRQPQYESEAGKAATAAATARLLARAQRTQGQAERAKARDAERVEARAQVPAAAAAEAAVEVLLARQAEATPPRRSMFADLLPALYEDGHEVRRSRRSGSMPPTTR